MLPKVVPTETSETQESTEDNFEYIPVQTVLRPLLISLKSQGLYYRRIQSHDNAEKRNKSLCDNIRPSVSSFIQKLVSLQTLSVICLTLSSLNILRIIPAFWVGIDFVPGATRFRIINLAWLLQCWMNRVIMFRACYKQDHIAMFFYQMNKTLIDGKSCCLRMSSKCSKAKSLVKIFVVMSWSIITTNSCFLVYMVFSGIQDNYDVTIANPFSAENMAAKVCFTLVFLMEGGAWILPVFFYITIFFLLQLHFKTFRKKLSQTFKDNKVLDNINDLRMWHLKLCKLVNIFESDVNVFVAASYVTNMFIACFTVYQMVSSKDLPVLTYVVLAIWFSSTIFITGFLSWGASVVNEEAHSALEVIYDIEMRGASHEQVAEVTLFLSKLTGPPIGFTAMGFMTITKEFILTLAGIFLTYFFLLLQFNI